MKISYRLVIIIAIFIACLISANTIAVKVIGSSSFFVPAAVVVFPISYIFGDILTEVYGYKVARRVIWLGFACNLLFVFFVWIGQILPGAPFWQNQEAYKAILGYTPRLLAASLAGYLVGEFINSFVLARMKILTKGRWLWSRTITSTIFGEGLDTAIFITAAYIGTSTFAPILIFNHWITKVGIEIVFTPLTYVVVNWLKRKEGIDTFDEKTRFNPFSFAEKGH
jgi:queuosine precursor transporter